MRTDETKVSFRGVYAGASTLRCLPPRSSTYRVIRDSGTHPFRFTPMPLTGAHSRTSAVVRPNSTVRALDSQARVTGSSAVSPIGIVIRDGVP